MSSINKYLLSLAGVVMLLLAGCGDRALLPLRAPGLCVPDGLVLQSDVADSVTFKSCGTDSVRVLAQKLSDPNNFGLINRADTTFSLGISNSRTVGFIFRPQKVLQAEAFDTVVSTAGTLIINLHGRSNAAGLCVPDSILLHNRRVDSVLFVNCGTDILRIISQKLSDPLNFHLAGDTTFSMGVSNSHYVKFEFISLKLIDNMIAFDTIVSNAGTVILKLHGTLK